MPKQINPTELTISVQEDSRQAVRAVMLQHWTKENPGSAHTRNTYRYNVETLANGTKIYLTRPTRLNKGCDFVIYAEYPIVRFKNGNAKPPKQSDIHAELSRLIKLYPSGKSSLLRGVQEVWECHDVNKAVQRVCASFPADAHLDIERLLKIAKWLFIEQDVTYWTESGREMLRNSIQKDFGELPCSSVTAPTVLFTKAKRESSLPPRPLI